MTIHRKWQTSEIDSKEPKTRMSIAIKPTKLNLYRKLAKSYGRTMSNLTEVLIDDHLAEGIFELTSEKIEKMRLKEEERKLLEMIKEEETCDVCKVRRNNRKTVALNQVSTNVCKFCWLNEQRDIVLFRKKNTTEPNIDEKLKEIETEIEKIKDEEDYEKIKEKYKDELKNIKGFLNKFKFLNSKLKEDKT